MIISDDLVINVESFLKCTLDCYLLKESRLCCDVLVLTEEEVAELIEAAFCDYIADYGIYIQRVYPKKSEQGIFIDYKYGTKKAKLQYEIIQ